MEQVVEVELQEVKAALVRAGLAQEEQALRIASLEKELQEARSALGREILEKANRQAATFLSSLTGGITDPSSPRN